MREAVFGMIGGSLSDPMNLQGAIAARMEAASSATTQMGATLSQIQAMQARAVELLLKYEATSAEANPEREQWKRQAINITYDEIPRLLKEHDQLNQQYEQHKSDIKVFNASLHTLATSGEAFLESEVP